MKLPSGVDYGIETKTDVVILGYKAVVTVDEIKLVELGNLVGFGSVTIPTGRQNHILDLLQAAMREQARLRANAANAYMAVQKDVVTTTDHDDRFDPPNGRAV